MSKNIRVPSPRSNWSNWSNWSRYAYPAPNLSSFLPAMEDDEDEYAYDDVPLGSQVTGDCLQAPFRIG